MSQRCGVERGQHLGECSPACDTDRMSNAFTSDGESAAAPEAETDKRGYHHGNLREALIAAARTLLAERGPEGFTLVDAARAAGVSPAAPYRHFRDREALLQAVALEGFREFGARQAGQPDPVSAFRAMGLAYLAFAEEEPGAYAAMFAGRAAPGVAGLQPAGETGFEALMRGLKPLIGDPPPPGVDPVGLACQVWALSHGVALLSVGGRLEKGFGVNPRKLLIEGIERLVRGTLPAARTASRPD
jgi:AcrR family transcriptional regulator